MACESCVRRRAKLARLATLAAERAKAIFDKVKPTKGEAG